MSKSSLYGDSIFEISSIVLSESDISILTEYFTKYPEVINEQYFSKKDLQDPETLRKLLSKFDKEKSTKEKIEGFSMALSFVESIAIGILSGSIGAGFISLIGLIIGKLIVIIKSDIALMASQEKRVMQLREQAIDLRDKAKKENTKEAKQIVDNCNKLINAIDQYLKTGKYKEAKELYEEYKDKYKYIIDVIHSKTIPDEPDKEDYIWCKLLHIDFKLYEQGMKNKTLTNNDHLWLAWFGTNDRNELGKEDETDIDTINILSKYIPEFKNNDSTPIFYSIDDTIYFYSKKANKFYFGDYWHYTNWDEKDIPRIYKSSILDFIKSGKCNNNHMTEKDIDISLLKAVDADLGYYRLSEPPKGVTPKKI